MKGKLSEYGVLVGEERQQVRTYRNMVCLLVKNTNKGVEYSSARFYELNEKNWQFLTHHEG